MVLEIDVDLRGLFGPVRDQGARPTCLAFAASDSHAGLRAEWDPLSCEFAFYHAQRRAGRTVAQGAELGAMLDALRIEGQPVEAGWPYLDAAPADPPNSSSIASNLAQIRSRSSENQAATRIFFSSIFMSQQSLVPTHRGTDWSAEVLPQAPLRRRARH